MTDKQAIRMLKAVRAYCQPEHLPAVDHAMMALMAQTQEKKEKPPLP